MRLSLVNDQPSVTMTAPVINVTVDEEAGSVKTGTNKNAINAVTFSFLEFISYLCIAVCLCGATWIVSEQYQLYLLL